MAIAELMGIAVDLANLLEQQGEATVLALGGLVVGCLFGFFAQRARFCLRAAVIDFWHHHFGERLAVWLLAFSTTVLVVQLLILSHLLDVSGARQFATRGSLSGALIGGLLFGIGMILTRGCASRLLILSANGNLRALLSGLVFAVAAQASLAGVLAPLRLSISEWWTVEPGPSRNILASLGLGNGSGALAGLLWLACAVYLIRHNPTHKLRLWISAIGCGFCVALAWWYTYFISTQSFEPIAIQGMTFSEPSAEWLMRVLSPTSQKIGFDFGMLPGVFVGSFIGAVVGKDLKLEGFKDGYSMTRYITGAILMGFGSMLAGGCAVGAGMTGGAIFAVTAWLTLIGMWIGAGFTDRLLDGASLEQQIFETPPAPAVAP